MLGSNPPIQTDQISPHDPSKNVLDLVDAAVRRIDDLHNAEAIWADKLRNSDLARLDQLRTAEIRRVDELMLLNTAFGDKLAKALDAANEKAAQRAGVLAQHQAVAASLAAQTSAQFTEQVRSLDKALTDRLMSLERSQYESKGRSALSDPLLEQLSAQMRQIAAGQLTTQGQKEGLSTAGVMLAGGVGLIATLIVIGGFVFTSNVNRGQTTTPQVVVSPAPAAPRAAP